MIGQLLKNKVTSHPFHISRINISLPMKNLMQAHSPLRRLQKIASNTRFKLLNTSIPVRISSLSTPSIAIRSSQSIYRFLNILTCSYSSGWQCCYYIVKMLVFRENLYCFVFLPPIIHYVVIFTLVTKV